MKISLFLLPWRGILGAGQVQIKPVVNLSVFYHTHYKKDK